MSEEETTPTPAPPTVDLSQHVTHDEATGATVVRLGPYMAACAPLLQPPVCNKMVHNAGALRVMIVGGPNTRADYHMNLGEEVFFQIKGDMCLKIMENNAPRDVIIREGEMFVLPGRIPHSPQRFENTIGLVIERERLEGELDGLRYYVDESNAEVLWQRFFPVTDLGSQLKPVIASFFGSEAFRTRVPSADAVPPSAWEPDADTIVAAPFALATRLREVLRDDAPACTLFKKEFVVTVADRRTQTPALPIDTECWVWALPHTEPAADATDTDSDATAPVVVLNDSVELRCNEAALLPQGLSAMTITGPSPVLILYTLAL